MDQSQFEATLNGVGDICKPIGDVGVCDVQNEADDINNVARLLSVLDACGRSRGLTTFKVELMTLNFGGRWSNARAFPSENVSKSGDFEFVLPGTFGAFDPTGAISG
ncbi:hypothetical protein AMTR_s00133p00071230 [Amborella trichopoda]|uniref:Uncharacterized protein n=1 Tax=Amborella trichopoda TaxID=13333 RepID=W1P923_AMBTC|nr:hypothetical protein AMTR_s00133p00071230 [Amborella trichopoda]